MSDNIIPLENSTKSEQYTSLIQQLKSLIADESDLIANMANTAAAIKQVFDFLWVGFYIVKQNQLVLGPFQGSVACTRIALGRGVCGTAWQQGNTLIVPDVDLFKGHIACSSLSRSEIVVPVFHEDNVVAVLDIDSNHIATFDEVDALFLEQIVQLIRFV
jgi:L-methionine (R)-S-oxide reductase